MNDTGADPGWDMGMAIRREVLGDEYVDRTLASSSEFTAPLQELVTRYAWGAVWALSGLDRRSRSMITLAVLTTLRAHDELRLHVRAALTNGLAPEEIAEVFLHAGVYAGMPAARSAFEVAAGVIDR